MFVVFICWNDVYCCWLGYFTYGKYLWKMLYLLLAAMCNWNEMYWETYLFHQINTQTVISLKYKAKTRQNGIDIIRNIDQNVTDRTANDRYWAIYTKFPHYCYSPTCFTGLSYCCLTIASDNALPPADINVFVYGHPYLAYVDIGIHNWNFNVFSIYTHYCTMAWWKGSFIGYPLVH